MVISLDKYHLQIFLRVTGPESAKTIWKKSMERKMKRELIIINKFGYIQISIC